MLWALAVLFLLFVGVILSIFKESFPLFRYSVVVVMVLYLALSFSHPDYIIAAVNVANAPESERNPFFLGEYYNDYRYLSTLSADAAPVLLPYMEKLGYDTSVIEEKDIFAIQNRKMYRGTRIEKVYGNSLKECHKPFCLGLS